MAVPNIKLKVPTGVTIDNIEEKLLAHAELLMTDQEEMDKRKLTTMGNPINLSPPVLTEDEWTDKQLKNTLAAAEEWEKKTLAPRRDPVAAAIAADGKRKANLEEAEKKGKWLKAMKNVDMNARQETIKEVGASGFKRGVEARRTKIKNKIKLLRPLVLANKETVGAMPDTTPEQREAKMIANLRGMRKIGDIIAGP